METNNTQPTLEKFCHGAATVLGLESALSGKPAESEWVKKVALWKTGLFRIVVMGEIKKGKSSFINALLGYKDLVPVCSDVATSTIFKICYGQEVGYKVFFFKTSNKTPIKIPASEINEYGTEDGNPGNEKQVEFIQVFCPSPLLKAGLVIVDTPGLGGLFKQHKRITYEYVPKADAVFLVTDSVESPIGQAELDLLADLKKVTKHIFFVQTKSRLVDVDAREARKANNLSILVSQAGFDKDKIKYFVVDSATKMIADDEKDLKKLDRSGFKDVAEFVNNFIRPNIHRLVMVRAIAEMRPHIDFVFREIEAQSSILQTRTQEERAKISEELQNRQIQIDEWEKKGKTDIKDRIERGLDEILSHATDQLNRFNPNGGEMILEIEQSINACTDVKDLQKKLDEFQQTLPNTISEALYQISFNAQQETSKLLREIAQDTMHEASNEFLQAQNILNAPISQERQDLDKGTLFEKARTLFYGGMAGSGIGAMIGSVIGGCIGFCCGGVGAIPGIEIGGAVGSLIGQPFGYFAAHKEQKTRQLDIAQKTALSYATKWLAASYQNMCRSFSNTFKNIRRQVIRELENAILQLNEENANRIAELKQMEHRSSEEIAVKSSELRKRQETFTQALSDMGLAQNVRKGA